MFRVVKQFTSHVIPHVIRPMRIVWNQVIGFLFLVLAVWSAPSLLRNVREYRGDAEGVFRVGLSAMFTLLMTGFGIYSFLRARRISRP